MGKWVFKSWRKVFVRPAKIWTIKQTSGAKNIDQFCMCVWGVCMYVCVCVVCVCVCVCVRVCVSVRRTTIYPSIGLCYACLAQTMGGRSIFLPAILQLNKSLLPKRLMLHAAPGKCAQVKIFLQLINPSASVCVCVSYYKLFWFDCRRPLGREDCQHYGCTVTLRRTLWDFGNFGAFAHF